MKPKLIFASLGLILLAAFFALILRSCGRAPEDRVSTGGQLLDESAQSGRSGVSETETGTAPVASQLSDEKKRAQAKADKKRPFPGIGEKKTLSVLQPPIADVPLLSPPAVQLFKELIPKDIEIVRVYYVNMLAAPGSFIEFDINGTGFTKEFEKMIKVESGQPYTTVKNLALITPNQIHGTLEISPKSATMVAFPQVLIGEKVVFQAPEPFAVIRPGEVLNLIFTEMGESGRSGRFRAFTNLNVDTFGDFKVSVSTPAIQVTDMIPTFPFIVDGTILIGPAVSGEYDIDIALKGRNIWHRGGIIRVVKPNVGQSGLVQRVQAVDGFHRPGDKVILSVVGSGFQPQDVSVLAASVKDLVLSSTTFTYQAPGRMELTLILPAETAEKTYDMELRSGDQVLQTIPAAFQVVGKNWTRKLLLSPGLVPGGTSAITLQGRDMTEEFISQFKVELDEPGLVLSPFKRINPQEASAIITAGKDVAPGDYLLHITSNGQPIHPQSGSIIRVVSPAQ